MHGLNPLSLGVNVGPVMAKTLIKHYLVRRKEGKSKARDELLFDEAFNIVKTFMELSTRHTVEDLQRFGNTHLPAPFWVHIVPVVVPMSSCNLAAKHLIAGFGGEEAMYQAAGGVRWWQVRGLPGVEAEWICMKKDYREYKEREKGKEKDERRAGEEKEEFTQDMDDLKRTILYIHGGAYYWGSINTHRYVIWRMARKMKGRAFAVNYRLAPQYGFPCQLQDCLAAYLYLTQPPPGSPHKAVNPKNIIIAGDSAGGGLSLALLTLLRDTGLPLPAGAVLISPWCDLTHSFPSILENTKTDIIPPFGFIHKPSTLWPPPPEDLLHRTREHLSTASPRRHLFSTSSPATAVSPIDDVPKIKVDDEFVSLEGQIQMYATNSQVGHPLVSPALHYLGGLCPLYVMASDKEVLRDEIIYAAHKAARPELYQVKDEVRQRHPVLEGIEERFGGTQVHLQVYDETCHVLPLFSMAEPAKHAYRAMAAFCLWATALASSSTDASAPATPVSPTSAGATPTRKKTTDPFIVSGVPSSGVPAPAVDAFAPDAGELTKALEATQLSGVSSAAEPDAAATPEEKDPPRKRLRDKLSLFTKSSAVPVRRQESTKRSVSGKSRKGEPSSTLFPTGPGMAGWSDIYEAADAFSDANMIRERVATNGVVRQMEPEDTIVALKMSLTEIGVFKEGPVKRYLTGQRMWTSKFKHTARRIEREREHQLQHAARHVQELSQNIKEDDGAKIFDQSEVEWRWQWALEDENPPPASIVARRDTEEARALARLVDSADETKPGSVNLWSLVGKLLSPGSSSRTGTAPANDGPWAADIAQRRSTIRRAATDRPEGVDSPDSPVVNILPDDDKEHRASSPKAGSFLDEGDVDRRDATLSGRPSSACSNVPEEAQRWLDQYDKDEEGKDDEWTYLPVREEMPKGATVAVGKDSPQP